MTAERGLAEPLREAAAAVLQSRVCSSQKRQMDVPNKHEEHPSSEILLIQLPIAKMSAF